MEGFKKRVSVAEFCDRIGPEGLKKLEATGLHCPDMRTLNAFEQADAEGWNCSEVRAAKLRAKVLAQARAMYARRIEKIDSELAELERRAQAAGNYNLFEEGS